MANIIIDWLLQNYVEAITDLEKRVEKVEIIHKWAPSVDERLSRTTAMVDHHTEGIRGQIEAYKRLAIAMDKYEKAISEVDRRIAAIENDNLSKRVTQYYLEAQERCDDSVKQFNYLETHINKVDDKINRLIEEIRGVVGEIHHSVEYVMIKQKELEGALAQDIVFDMPQEQPKRRGRPKKD